MKTIAGIPEDEIEKVKAKCVQAKCLAFDELKYLITSMQYRSAGYKSIEDAAIKIINQTAQECEKKMRNLEKKYPLEACHE